MDFCTISTSDFDYKVYALCNSLRQIDEHFTLHVLFIDNAFVESSFPQIKKYDLNKIAKTETAQSIIQKYEQKKDKLRWSLKPVFLKYLLKNEHLDSAIYLDNDLCFFSDFTFLFNYLEDHSFILTPHNYERRPDHSQNMLEANYRVGLYNAGFVGANKKAIDTLQWWAECCLYRCEKNAFRGTFDDQKYLDLIPVINEDALIVRHQGCNVAEWNRYVCFRFADGDSVLINNKYPIVFIHFNYTTIREIENGNDPLLVPFYDGYFKLLQAHKNELQRKDLIVNPSFIERCKYQIWKFSTKYGF